MKQHIAQIAALGLLAAGMAIAPVMAHAQDAGANAPADQSATPKPKHNGRPVHGKISAVDTQGMTLKIASHTFQITSETKMFKDGKPATLSDAVVGEEVRGFYQKTASGSVELLTVYFGPKNAEEPKTPNSDEK